MELKRFFAEKDAYDGENIIIKGDEFYHMFKVLRHKIGYDLIVSLGDGKDYYSTITQIEKDFAIVKVNKIEPNPCHTDMEICLFQALPKGSKIDFIIQKCVELGVKTIYPFNSAYVNETKFAPDRLKRVSIEAAKQTGIGVKPFIGDLISFDEMLNKLSSYDLVVCPYEKATTEKIKNIEFKSTIKSIAYVIGSEGGFKETEIKEIEDRGAKIISLGCQILKSDTAAIITAALIRYKLGEI